MCDENAPNDDESTGDRRDPFSWAFNLIRAASAEVEAPLGRITDEVVRTLVSEIEEYLREQDERDGRTEGEEGGRY